MTELEDAPIPFGGTACTIYRVIDGRLYPVTLAGLDDELVLCVSAVADGQRSRHGLSIELWRGESRRDCHLVPSEAFVSEPHFVCFRLRWGDSPSASMRLIGRVLDAGIEVARAEVILDRADFDGQGRLVSRPDRPMTDQTMLAFGRVLQQAAPGNGFQVDLGNQSRSRP